MVSGYCWRWRGPHLWRWRDSHIFGGWESHTAQLGHPCACPYAAKKIAGTPGFNLGILHMPICCQIDWYTWAQPGASCAWLYAANSTGTPGLNLGILHMSICCKVNDTPGLHLGNLHMSIRCNAKSTGTLGLNLGVLHMSTLQSQ